MFMKKESSIMKSLDKGFNVKNVSDEEAEEFSERIVDVKSRVDALNIPDRRVFDKAYKIGVRISEKLGKFKKRESEELRLSILNDMALQKRLLKSVGLEDIYEQSE